MRLSYTDLLGDKQRHEIDATISTEHSASSYGIPVIVLPDGEALSIASWMMLRYEVVDATKEELAGLLKVLQPYTMPTQDTSAAAAVMGSRSSASKTAAARANGRKGGRPRKTDQ